MASRTSRPDTGGSRTTNERAAWCVSDTVWLRAVFEQAPDPIIILDLEANILNANPAACRLHGVARDALIGRHVLTLVPESARDRAQADWPDWISGKLTSREGESLGEDGSITPVDVRASHMVYAGQEAMLFMVRDISRRRALDGQNAQAEKMEALGKLAGGIAHDFNNLLMVILNNGAFVREEIPPGSPAHKDLDQLAEATKEAAALTGQLLCFSRKQMFCPRPVDLGELVRSAGDVLQQTAGTGIEFRMDLPDKALWVKADPQQIEQGLVNLVVNAREAMEEGGQLTLRLSEVELAEEDADRFVEAPTQDGAYARMDLHDTGRGVDAALSQRIFEPFFTTKSRGRGTGLGLSTTYGMVRQHEGYMSVRTPVGQGAVFSIYLPTHRETEAPVAAEAAPEEPAEGRGVILLAEDSHAVRAATRRMLERLGYQVLEAADGVEALEVAAREEKEIDLLFTDVVMPNMDGKTLADEMCRRYPQTRVVFASGYPEDHLKDHGLIAKNVALLQKPFNREQAARAVSSVMD